MGPSASTAAPQSVILLLPQEVQRNTITTTSAGCRDTASISIYDPAQTIVYAGKDIYFPNTVTSINLQGSVTGSSVGAIWSTTGTESFSPSPTRSDAVYHLSEEDRKKDKIYFILTPAVPASGNCNVLPDTMTAYISNCTFEIYSVVSGNTSYYTVSSSDTSSLGLYTWSFSNGRKITGDKVTVNFSAPGHYNVLAYYMREDSTCYSTASDTIEISSVTSPLHTISSTVKAGSDPLDKGIAAIYKVENNTVYLAGAQRISSEYHFTDLADGTYILLAGPAGASSYKDSYLPTYYEQASTWKNARFLNIHSDTSFTVDLLVNSDPLNTNGQDSVTGTVTLPVVVLMPKASATHKIDNQVPYAIVTLANPSGFELTCITDEYGRYGFGQIPAGVYFLTVDYPGTEKKIIKVAVDGNTSTLEETNIELQKSTAVTGIFTTASAESVLFYPNPAGEKAYVELPQPLNNAKLKVFNTTGELMMETTVSGEKKLAIDTKELPEGLYILQITDGSRLYQQRFTR